MSLKRFGVGLSLLIALAGCSEESKGNRDGGLMSHEGATDPDGGGGTGGVGGSSEPVGGSSGAGMDGGPKPGKDAMTPEPGDDARVPDDSSMPDDSSTPDDSSMPDDSSTPIDATEPEPDARIPDPSECEPWTALVEPEIASCEQEPPPDVGPFGNRIALTFDDGPHPVRTPAILEILRNEQIPATFFMVGRNLQTVEARAIAKEIHEDPLFRVANHTFTHARLPMIDLAQVAVQIDDTSAAIRTALEDPCYFPRFVRFPYSDSDCPTMQVVRERGFAVAGLHIDPVDWCYARDMNAEDGITCLAADAAWVPEEYRNDMVGYVISQLPRYGGGIVLLHDIHANTVAQLQDLIDALRAEGVTFVALDDEEHFPMLNAQLEVPEPPACCGGVTR
jgi:peptidoglycan/xylan/chitin deacetylase (PgdA/CDA1 family)